MRKILFSKATGWIVVVMFVVGAAVAAGASSWKTFNFEDKGPGKALKLKVPDVTFTAAEEEALYAGKPVTRMFDRPGGLKAGYLRFFTNFDPVTTWMIVTDAEHFDLEDPSFPQSGSMTEKRNTFMPYTFDVTTCVKDGANHMGQLLVMPFVAPRKLCIRRIHDTNGFPFESTWQLAGETCCEEGRKADLKDLYEKAVSLKKNVGSWNISPLPKKLRKTEADIMRTDCVYFVDTDPGGDLSKMKALVNKAQSVALPKVAENVNFHGKRWEQHLAKQFGADVVQQYKNWVAEYKQAMAGK